VEISNVMKGQRKILSVERNVFFTGIVSFFMDLSSEMIYPLVPIFLSSVLGVNRTLIGLIEGVAESTASILKVFSGWLSDRIRRRKIIIIAGYGISTLSRPILALSTLWEHVLIFRFIDRFGKGIRVSPRDAIIAESTPSKDLGRSFGFHRGMDTLGAVIGPATAFFILLIFEDNFRIVFWLSFIPATISVLVIYLFIKETTGDRTAPVPKFSLKAFDWRYKAFITTITLFSIGNSSDAFLILRATNIGIEKVQIPVLYLFFNLVYSIVSMPAGILSDRIGRRRIILSGFILFGVIYWGFAKASEEWHIWGLFLLYGLFMGLTEGVHRAYLSTIIPAHLKATAYGIYNTSVGIALLPASIIGGYLWDRFGAPVTFYYGAMTAFLSALIFTGMIIFERKIFYNK